MGMNDLQDRETSLVVFNARIYPSWAHMPAGTGVPTAEFSGPDGIYIERGRVRYMGTSEEARNRGKRIGLPDDRVIDARGGMLVPGLIDGHVHLLWYGERLNGLELSDCRSLHEMLSLVKEHAERLPRDGWVMGGGWHEEKMKERRLPTRHDLDAVCPHRPVFLIRSCTHVALVNTLALRTAGIDENTADPDGGVIGRDESGSPNGLLYENAQELVRKTLGVPSSSTRRKYLIDAMREAAKYGITSVHTNDPSILYDYSELYRSGDLSVRVYLDECLDDEVIKTYEEGLGGVRVTESHSSDRRDESIEEWVRRGAVKIYEDGSFGARTAALSEPYDDAPHTSGMLIHEVERLKEIVTKWHLKGRQVAIHAIGDRAVAAALDAIGAARSAGPEAKLRHRIVHCALVNPTLLPRIKELGVVVDAQPAFVPYEIDWLPERLGPNREVWAYALNSVLRERIVVTAGSDAPVSPIDPRVGLYGGVTRMTLPSGRGRPMGPWVPQERVSLRDVLKMYTHDAAWAEGGEAVKGILRPGGFGDLTLFSDDLFTLPPEELAAGILETSVTLTVAGGRITWRAPRIG